MATFIFILTVVSSLAAAWGSLLFIDYHNRPTNYELGAMVFTIANAINITIGIHSGDIVLISSQAGLMYFTLPMYKNKIHSVICLTSFIILVCILGIASSFHATASLLGVVCSIIAILGAWYMDKNLTKMAICWLIADLGFILVAILNHLPMLGLLALVFVYHSSLRLLGYKRTGLFTCTKEVK